MVWTSTIRGQNKKQKKRISQSIIQHHYSWSLTKDVLNNDFRRKKSA